MRFLYSLCAVLCLVSHTTAQVNYNANTHTTTYNDYFLYGSNMTSPPSGWDDKNLAEVLIGNPSGNVAGAGATSLRPALYEWFVNDWGYNVRLNEFKYYQQLGAKNNTIFLNGASDAHLDKTQYCAGSQQYIFANLYEPIWVNGAINNNNYYAKYVYNVAKTYGPYVKFWEVWNEPDLVGSWQVTQNWGTTNPNPCDLSWFKAPIQRYVRMLRITYEVVKSVDPDAFICVGGIGYPSFLDAILRNTDNPTDGSVSGEYTLKGGAWFDCLSYHIYPMFYLGNTRNSDAAAKSIVTYKNDYEAVLAKYGYNGTTYPKKEFIITECNIPSKPADGYIGSDEAQRNFLIKAAVTCQKSSIHGLYVFQVHDTGNDSFGSMGLYEKITGGKPADAKAKSSAIAWRAASTLLKERRFDKTETAALQLPANVDGGAFYSEKDKNYVYVLWAKQTGDNTESGAATYSFPAAMEVKSMKVYAWDQKESTATGNSINLTGSPVFVKVSATVVSVTGVSLNKTSTTLTTNQTETLTATVSPANATNKNVTWSSSNTNIVTVSAGVITAKAAGTATVTATTADGGKTATCTVTVTAPATIAVTGVTLNKTSTTLAVNQTETLTATVSPANATNKNVTWSSSNTNIVTVSAGVITAKAAGTATVTATTADGGKTATCTVTVTAPATIAVTGVTLNKTSTTLAVNQTETLTATVSPANATNKAVTWSSSNTNIVTVSAGVITAKAAGTAKVTATTTDGGKTATCTVTVTAPATIAVTGVTLNKTSATLAVNQTETLTATVSPANATNKAVTWGSSNTNVATVSSTGVVTAKAAGTATITVRTTDGGKAASCTVTVISSTTAVSSVALNKTVLILPMGKTEILAATITPANATNKNVTWISSDPSVASVSGTGTVTANKAGTAVITVRTTDGGKTATCAVTVTAAGTIVVTGVTLSKTALTLAPGKSETLIATVIPANATNKTMKWSSSNTSVATINSGIVTAVKAGTATISVITEDGNKASTCSVTVSSVTGVDDMEARLVTAYPNPNTGQFTLNFEKQGTYHIAIANMAGKVFFRETVSDSKYEVDISAQPAGVFLVMVDNGKRRITIKVIKQ